MSTNGRFDLLMVQLQISNLIERYPELKTDPELKLDMIEGSTDAFELIRWTVRRIQKDEAFAEAMKIVINNDRERKQYLERRSQEARETLLQILETADVKNLPTPEATLVEHAGRPSVRIIDESAIPDVLFRVKTTREPNRERILEMLSAGHRVAGCELSNAKPHLTILTGIRKQDNAS